MKIYKILNNNVAVVIDEYENERIVMGRGICFHKKNGDKLDDDNIDKTFLLANQDASNKFQQLVKDVLLEYVELSEEIIKYAKLKLGKKLNDMIYVSLVDHLFFTVRRFQDGAMVKNNLLWDIKRFYQDEFKIGQYTLDLIEKRFDIRLPEDEAAFITLHLINAYDNNELSDHMYEITEVMQAICNIVKYTFHREFDEENVYYYRFITHLKFFAQRLILKKTYEGDGDDELLNIIKKRYHNSYMCVCKVTDYLNSHYQYELSDEEKMYLTIHIEQVVSKMNQATT